MSYHRLIKSGCPDELIGFGAQSMRGQNLRCVEGRLYRHDPQHDDPDLETDIGECPDCSGDGCGDDGEPVSKAGRSARWHQPENPT